MLVQYLTNNGAYSTEADDLKSFVQSRRSDLVRVVVPDGVTRLEEGCFLGCSRLEGVRIPSGLTDIGDDCFAGCFMLSDVNIPSGVERVGRGAFHGCFSLRSVDIPGSVRGVGDGCFAGCTSLRAVMMGSGVETIGGRCFDGCASLERVEIPDSVTSVGFRCIEPEIANRPGVYLGESVRAALDVERELDFFESDGFGYVDLEVGREERELVEAGADVLAVVRRDDSERKCECRSARGLCDVLSRVRGAGPEAKFRVVVPGATEAKLRAVYEVVSQVSGEKGVDFDAWRRDKVHPGVDAGMSRRARSLDERVSAMGATSTSLSRANLAVRVAAGVVDPVDAELAEAAKKAEDDALVAGKPVIAVVSFKDADAEFRTGQGVSFAVGSFMRVEDGRSVRERGVRLLVPERTDENLRVVHAALSAALPGRVPPFESWKDRCAGVSDEGFGDAKYGENVELLRAQSREISTRELFDRLLNMRSKKVGGGGTGGGPGGGFCKEMEPPPVRPSRVGRLVAAVEREFERRREDEGLGFEPGF